MSVPNPGKTLAIDVDSAWWERLPIRTHVIRPTDQLGEILATYVKPILEPGDLIVVSERIVAITQGRAYPITDIHPTFLARVLVRFVHKSPYGIGIASPWTMELAIREAGVERILLAALVSAFTKPFGIRGVFYKIAGPTVAAIDGPCDYTLAPYNEYAKLGPKDPCRVARELAHGLGAPVAIVDANDLGVAVLGRSDGVDDAFVKAAFRDNPLGQSDEQTPIAIVRKA